MTNRAFGILAAAVLTASPAFSGDIAFDGNWQEQRFSLFSKNTYGFEGQTLRVQSNGSVSMAYLPLAEKHWTATIAKWNWSVTKGVPATDLTMKGGDDRNLSLYAVFLPEAEARAAKGAGIRKLLGAENARVLVYVWGGAHQRGDMLESPYLGPRGKTIVLRGTGDGAHRETVDLSRDYARAFGGTSGALVGLAVSADSDDTDSMIDASIARLALN